MRGGNSSPSLKGGASLPCFKEGVFVIGALLYLAGGLATVYLLWLTEQPTAEPITLGFACLILWLWPLIALVVGGSFICQIQLPPKPNRKVKGPPPEIEAARQEVERWLKP